MTRYILSAIGRRIAEEIPHTIYRSVVSKSVSQVQQVAELAMNHNQFTTRVSLDFRRELYEREH